MASKYEFERERESKKIHQVSPMKRVGIVDVEDRAGKSLLPGGGPGSGGAASRAQRANVVKAPGIKSILRTPQVLPDRSGAGYSVRSRTGNTRVNTLPEVAKAAGVSPATVARAARRGIVKEQPAKPSYAKMRRQGLAAGSGIAAVTGAALSLGGDGERKSKTASASKPGKAIIATPTRGAQSPAVSRAGPVIELAKTSSPTRTAGRTVASVPTSRKRPVAVVKGAQGAAVVAGSAKVPGQKSSTRKEFERQFAKARKAGRKTFEFKGKSYNTKLK